MNDQVPILDYYTPSTAPSLLSDRLRKLIMPVVLIVGVQCWLVLGRNDYGNPLQLKLLLAILILSPIPPINRWFYAALNRIRHPSRRGAIIAAVVIFMLASAYFPYTGWRQGRDFSPKWQDELSYMIQFHMLARGKLWMHAHPLADFFDTFQVIVTPVYASMYFPGAALLYAPLTWVHVPYWCMSVGACAATVALAYLIMTELIDGVAGALAAIMFIGNTMLRKLSLMIGGHPPVLLLGSAMIYAWLRWRSSRSRGWAIVLGALAGWCAITRPLDAVIFATPIAIDALIWLARSPSKGKRVSALACLILPALPFLALQLVFNIGVTGKWSQTPFELYAQRDYPDTTLGFHPYDPSHRPVSTLPQKQKFHDDWTVPAIKQHTPDNVVHKWLDHDLTGMLTDLLPNRMIIALLPAGLLGLADRRRVLLWSIIPLFIVLYSFYTFYLPHYAIIAIHSVTLTALLGAAQIESTWPRARAAVGTLLTLFILVLSVTETAELNRVVLDQRFDPDTLRKSNQILASLPHKPAVVLFHFPPDQSPHIEPVYNFDVAWPDDAEIVRAHDLGPRRNVEIFRYYAEHQPQRAFYLYDRADDSIRFLGFAPDLAKQQQTP